LLVDVDIIWIDAFSRSGEPVIVKDFKSFGKLLLCCVLGRRNQPVVPMDSEALIPISIVS
jgi:hypothetical protein